MQAILVMFRSDGERRSFSVTRDMTVVGRREDCDLRIPLGEVSRKHARLVRDGDMLRLEDLGSSNGTYLNGQRVQEAVLSPGDSVQIGPVVFVLQVDGMPADDDLNPITADISATAEAPSVSDMTPLSPTVSSEVGDGMEELEALESLEPLADADDAVEMAPTITRQTARAKAAPAVEPEEGLDFAEMPAEDELEPLPMGDLDLEMAPIEEEPAAPKAPTIPPPRPGTIPPPVRSAAAAPPIPMADEPAAREEPEELELLMEESALDELPPLGEGEELLLVEDGGEGAAHSPDHHHAAPAPGAESEPHSLASGPDEHSEHSELEPLAFATEDEMSAGGSSSLHSEHMPLADEHSEPDVLPLMGDESGLEELDEGGIPLMPEGHLDTPHHPHA